MTFSLFSAKKSNNQHLAFWFIRHAESEGNAEGRYCPVQHDTLLTEQGTADAASMVTFLKDRGVALTDVYSSPLTRARDTAQIIADGFGLPVKTHDGLRERNWGEYRDLVWDELAGKLDGMDLEERYTFIPEGGESWQQMEDRLFAALSDIADESDQGEHIAIVTHRGCLRAMLPILGQNDKAEHKDFSVETASLTKFSFAKDGFEFVGEK